jgi:hypothetical protein
MRVMKKILFLFVLSFLVVRVANATPDPVPMVGYENVPIVTTTGTALPLSKIREVIIKSTQAANWSIQNSNSNGPIVAVYDFKNKHFATVKISYTPNDFSIVYENSTNLKYKVSEDYDSYEPTSAIPGSGSVKYPKGTKLIHPVYNQWIKNLKEKILAGFRGE